MFNTPIILYVTYNDSTITFLINLTHLNKYELTTKLIIFSFVTYNDYNILNIATCFKYNKILRKNLFLIV